MIGLDARGLFLVPLLGACASMELHEVRLQPSAGVTSHVAVFVRGQVPPRPVRAVALLQATGHGGDAKLDPLLHRLSKRAQELGCDVLSDLHFTEGVDLMDVHAICGQFDSSVLPLEGK